MTIALLMPAFNEQGTIGEVIERLPSHVRNRPVRVTVIDDGSTDATAAIARQAGAEVISNPANNGKGWALRRGLRQIKEIDPEAVVWMDSDGQHQPEALESIAESVLDGSADMVVGSRYLASSQIKAPLNRRLVRWAAIRAIASLTGFRLTDPFSGYRCFSAAAVQALKLTGDRYECELEAFFSVIQANLSVKEVPIPRLYSGHCSKMGHSGGRVLGRSRVVLGYLRTLLAQGSNRSSQTNPHLNV